MRRLKNELGELNGGDLTPRVFIMILINEVRTGAGWISYGGCFLRTELFFCGIKASFWGSGALKIVRYVENHPQKRSFWLADYHPLWVGGVN